MGVISAWKWDGGYGRLGYIYSFKDDQQAGSGDNGTRTDAFKIGFGLDEGRWSLESSTSFKRSGSSKAKKIDLEPSVSLSYRPDGFPDLTLSAETDHFWGDYTSKNEMSRSGFWEVMTDLDFSKFWFEHRPAIVPMIARKLGPQVVSSGIVRRQRHRDISSGRL